jgi:hypothetical protein
MTSRRETSGFKDKVEKALEGAEAWMARTRAMLLGKLPRGSTTEAGADAPATGRNRRKNEASG